MDIRKFFPVTTTKTTFKKYNNNSISENNNSISENNTHLKEATTNTTIKTDLSNCTVFEAFTDGSTINNGSKKKIVLGGVGVYFNEQYPSISLDLNTKLAQKEITNITNNIAELYAIKIAIDYFINLDEFNTTKDKIVIYTDSEYAINCVTKWCPQWIKNNWKKYGNKQVKNRELIEPIFNYRKQYKIHFVHVKSHTKEPYRNTPQWRMWYGNKKADELAVNGSFINKNKLNNMLNKD